MNSSIPDGVINSIPDCHNWQHTGVIPNSVITIGASVGAPDSTTTTGVTGIPGL